MWAELDLEAMAAKKDAGAGVPSAEEIEQIVVMVRLELYNRGLACGPKALRRRLGEHYAFTPLPSQRTIARILSRSGLTNGRTGFYDGEDTSVR